MKDGDILTCKKTYYDGDSVDTFTTKINNIFKSPIFRKGKEYKIDKVVTRQIYLYFVVKNPYTGGTYAIYPKVSQGSQGSHGPFTQGPPPPQAPSVSITTTSTTGSTSTTRPTNCTIVYEKDYFIKGRCLNESTLMNIFLSLKEQRNMKLKKIMEVQ